MELNKPSPAATSTKSQGHTAAALVNMRGPTASPSSPGPSKIWEYTAVVIIVFIVFSDGVSRFNLPGIVLLTWAAVAKYRDIAAGMSDKDSTKRKREENKIEILESEIQGHKRLRETGKLTAADEKIFTTEIKSLDSEDECSKVSEDGEKEEGSADEAVGNESHHHDDHGDGSCDCEEEEEDELKSFREVLATISLENVPELASTLRFRRDPKVVETNGAIFPAPYIDCVVGKPLSGSFNLFYPIEFTDGVKWGLRVPAIGTVEKFDRAAAKAMKTEVLTMGLLKRKTTIPIPAIYGFDISTENVLNCPYILMEFVEGTRLREKWFDKSLAEDELEEIRTRALKEIAEATIQLGQFRYNAGGALVFKDGNPIDVGPMRIVDDLDMFDEGYGSIHEVGPFSDPIAAITRKLDVHAESSSDFIKTLEFLLRLFLSWIPQGPEPKFVLRHPDFDIQNFIVADNGSLLAIIDWDGVCTEPRIIGNEAYPLYLMRDLAPVGMIDDAGQGCSCGSCGDECSYENTPEEYARYRAMYLGFIKNSKAHTESDTDTSASPIDVTKISILTCGLANATIPEYTDEILQKVFGDMCQASANDPRRPMSSYEKTIISIGEEAEQKDLAYHLWLEICEAIKEGTLSDDRMAWLRDTFVALFTS